MLKPIIFNTKMVWALLDKRKSVDRRVIKPQPTQPIPLGFTSFSTRKKNIGCYSWGKDEYGGIIDNRRPRYKIGDILYVKETWKDRWGMAYAKYGTGEAYPIDEVREIEYRAGGNGLYKNGCNLHPDAPNVIWDEWSKWKPSTHMPEELARIFLRVTYVRVERLQDITGYQVEKEGLRFVYNPLIYQDKETFTSLAHHKYKTLWNSTIKKKDLPLYGWDANPWCWVIDFERISKEEALGA